MQKVSWQDVENLTRSMGQKIKQFQKIDYVYGVPRGGYTPAVILSHILEAPILEHEEQVGAELLVGKTVLIVDDINDSGKTLKGWSMWPNAQTAVIYERVNSTMRADWVGETIEHNGWFIFPWEVLDNATEEMIDYLERRHGSVGV